MTWHIQNLKNIIFEMFGEEQVKLASAPLESIFENQDFSRFHYSELQRLIDLHVDERSSDKDYFNLVMTNDIDVLNQEHEFKVACKANIMALLRCLHCITDLLGHAIYYSLGLNLDSKTKLDVKYLNYRKVKEKLCKLNGSEELIEELERFTSHDDFVYLNGLVNHSKHRANITSKLTYKLGQEGKKVYQFDFPPFEYDKDNYDKKAVSTFLNNEYDRQSEQIIVIGNKINSLLEHANKRLWRQ